jgi:hypothetical protein
MELVPIEVICHSGHKADEYPKFFTWKDEEFRITEITDRWYQGDRDPETPAADYFKVLTVLGGTYLLRHELDEDKWYLVQMKK